MATTETSQTTSAADNSERSARRGEILKSIRQHQVPAVPLPDLAAGCWIEYPDPPAEFAAKLATAGGQTVRIDSLANLPAALREVAAYSQASQRASLIPGVGEPNVNLDAIEDPHELADVDFALLAGQFGVAENGAIWLTDEQLQHRVLPFIVQHLGLVIEAKQILSNMHQAYERITKPEANFGKRGFGLFLAGPSKTADIEQSLVIGAHGPRSLTVFILES